MLESKPWTSKIVKFFNQVLAISLEVRDDKCIFGAVVVRKIGRYHPKKILPSIKYNGSGIIFIPTPINIGIKKTVLCIYLLVFCICKLYWKVWFISMLGLMACGFKLAVVICGNGNALKKR